MKRAILLSAKEQFESNNYDPLQCMIDLAKQEVITMQDQVRFQMHRELARKYFPDVTAVKVDGRMDVVQTMDASQRQARIDALLVKRQTPGDVPYVDA